MRAVTKLALAVAVCAAIGAEPLPARAQPVADHLACHKIKDPLPKGTYTADLDGLTAEPGCVIKVPAKLACVPSTKTNVTPTPPGGGAVGVPNTYLCYTVKCPKGAASSLAVQDQFGSRTVDAKPTKILCAPAAIPTTTTSTTSTTTTTLVCGTCPPPPDACHLDGTCNPLTGTCSYPVAPDGTVCDAPNASGACAGGACAMTCALGWFDVNGVAADGCECQGPNVGAVCGTRTILGTVSPGGNLTVSGKLVPAGREAWYLVTFSGASAQRLVSFASNPGFSFVFDLFTDCSFSAATCTDGIPPTGRIICPVSAAGTYVVRVRRQTGAVTCDDYTLRFTN